MSKLFSVGDIVKAKRSFLNEPPGVLAYVYEEYNIGTSHPGVSIITQNGRDLGGFSYKEQQEFLEFVKKSNMNYQFHSVTRLADDFRKGIFKNVFDQVTA